MERLDYWFTDETRSVLFLQSSQNEPSADNSDHRIHATEEDNTAGPSTSQVYLVDQVFLVDQVYFVDATQYLTGVWIHPN